MGGLELKGAREGLVVVLRCGVGRGRVGAGALCCGVPDLVEGEDYEVGDPLFGWVCEEGLRCGISEENGVCIGPGV